MKNFLLLLSCVFVSVSASAQFLEWNSLAKEGSSGQSTILGTEINSGGDVFFAGNFQGSLDLDPNVNATLQVNTPSGSQGNVFFAAYDSDGDLVHGKHVWGKSEILLGGMAIDAGSNTFLTGYFNDSIDLNPNSTQAIYLPTVASAEDAFLVKYNSLGLFQWARQLNSSVRTRPIDIVLDQSGNLLVTGTFNGQTDFNPSSGVNNLVSVNEDIFIAKYNASGNYVNAISIGSFGGSTGVHDVMNIDVDNSNNIYISGRFEGDVDFDPSGAVNLLTANGKNDFYIAKYNSSLQLVWVYQMGSARGEGLISHKINDNELWIAASYRDTIDVDLKLGSALHSSNGGFDVYFGQYNLSANHLMSESFGGSGDDEVTSIDVYNSDSLFISGHFEGTVDFDPGSGSKSLTSSASKSMFFGSYRITGELNWISKVAGSGDITSTLIRSSSDGKAHISGNLRGGANFNDASQFSKVYTGPASFVAKYDKCGRVDINLTSVDATCGEKDGSALASVTGGTAPLRFFWTSGSLDSIADSLRSGIYYVTVVDTLKCSYYSDPVLINETGGPSVSLTTKVDVLCHGDKTGAIVLNVSGGTSPYTYAWSNNANSKDINGLKAGNYEVKVTDDDNCSSLLRVAIDEPDPIQVYPIITKPACGSSNGNVTAVVTGGTPTYSYSWQPSGTGNSLFNISAGVYKVTITDGNNCTYSQSIPVSNDKAPDILLDSVQAIACGNGGGSIYVSVFGGSQPYNYNWDPTGASTQDLIAAPAGEHELEVLDQANCLAYYVESIDAKVPIAPDVCIVDVDSINGKAVVLWEKPVNRGSIDYYSIYRETSTLNQFDLVRDSIEFTELSLYEDRIADTWTRPWSYKLSFTDTCGIESDLSEYHTTIHAVISMNAQTDFNVLWTPYRGNFPVNSYTVFRYTDVNGFDSLTTVPANIFSYTDVNSPSKGPDVYYYVRIDHPSGCTATEVQNRNSSRSNRGSIDPPLYLGDEVISTLDDGIEELLMFPNPANEVVKIDLSGINDRIDHVSIYNNNGQLEQKEILDRSDQANISIDISALSNGLYLVRAMGEEKIYSGKLIISRN